MGKYPKIAKPRFFSHESGGGDNPGEPPTPYILEESPEGVSKQVRSKFSGGNQMSALEMFIDRLEGMQMRMKCLGRA